ncbi:NAD(P)-dependent oxidoreductase [Chitinophagaceae bacterium MMS25-I14]
MNITKAGWIGLGNMGTPMSQQLLKAGYPLIVYNRHKEKEETLRAMGAATAPTPAELMQQTDVIFIMVSDDKAIHDVFSGDRGLLRAKSSGKIIVNMSTVSPGISREYAAQLKEQGNEYLDAPVSGSVRQAEDGQLIIMAGGPKAAFEKVQPLFSHMGKMALHLGDSGAGNTAKLAINTFLGISAQALAESVLFAQQQGVQTEDFITIINNSALGNAFNRIKGDAIIQNNYRPAFALKHIVKDLNLAKNEGLSSPLAKVSIDTYTAAASTLGEEDIIAVVKYIGSE